MKKYLIGLICCALSVTATAQNCSLIVGKWLNKGGQGQVEIYQQNGKYNGKLIWIKTPNDVKGQPLKDQRNIRPALRKRALLGLEILKSFTCNGHTYSTGTIYDPRHGKNFNCLLTLNGDKLKVDAYMGMFAVGSEIWTRVKH